MPVVSRSEFTAVCNGMCQTSKTYPEARSEEEAIGFAVKEGWNAFQRTDGYGLSCPFCQNCAKQEREMQKMNEEEEEWEPDMSEYIPEYSRYRWIHKR